MKVCKECGVEYIPFGVTVRRCPDCYKPYHRARTRAYNAAHRDKIRDTSNTWTRKTWALYKLYIAEHPQAKRRFRRGESTERMAYIRDCAHAYLREHPKLGTSIGKARV